MSLAGSGRDAGDGREGPGRDGLGPGAVLDLDVRASGATRYRGGPVPMAGPVTGKPGAVASLGREFPEPKGAFDLDGSDDRRPKCAEASGGPVRSPDRHRRSERSARR